MIFALFLLPGQHAKAKKHFQLALEQNTKHIEAAKNLETMKQYYHNDQFYPNAQDLRATNHIDIQIEHKVRKMPRVAVEDLFKPENIDFMSGKRPFILTGALTSARGYNSSWWDPGRVKSYTNTHIHPENQVQYVISVVALY